MSLDFYLESEPHECTCVHCDSKIMRQEEVFWRNITHNLGRMADAAGIYEALWRPDENGYKQAKDIVPILKEGLSDLMCRREHYEKYNSPNGWGTYENFISFVQAILQACEDNQEALIRVSR